MTFQREPSRREHSSVVVARVLSIASALAVSDVAPGRIGGLVENRGGLCKASRARFQHDFLHFPKIFSRRGE